MAHSASTRKHFIGIRAKSENELVSVSAELAKRWSARRLPCLIHAHQGSSFQEFCIGRVTEDLGRTNWSTLRAK